MKTEVDAKAVRGTPECIACQIVCDFYEKAKDDLVRAKNNLDLDFCEPTGQFVDVVARYIEHRNNNKSEQIVVGTKYKVLKLPCEKKGAVRAFLKEMLWSRERNIYRWQRESDTLRYH